MTTTLSPHHETGRWHGKSGDAGSGLIRLLIVDDHPAVRLGARALLDDQPDMRVVAEARSTHEALGKLDSPIDVAVIDYHLREGGDGLTVIPQLAAKQPDAKVLVYSAFAGPALAVAALVAGADGLLGKHELGDELCHAIRRLARGQRYLPAIPPGLAHAMGAGLEPREQTILAMLLYGTGASAIAERLSITEQELAGVRASILRTLSPRGPELGLLAQRAAPLDYERAARGRAAA